jgi:hypothetical protein
MAGSPVICQPQQNQSKLWGTSHQANNANIQLLKEAPELPQLPSYSGNPKFLRGYMQPTGKGWVVYHVSFLTKEEPTQVKDWYQSTLSMYQWKILSSGSCTLTANHKDGHMCTLLFNPTTKRGYHTQLGVFYSVAPRLATPDE